MRTRPVKVDDADLQPARGAVAAGGAAAAQRAATKEKYFGFKYSLRKYAAILYRVYPKGFSIVLRGEAVEPRSIVKDMKHARVEKYTPTGLKQTYKIHVR